MDGINMRILGELPIVLPPLDEQDEILESVREETQCTETAIQAVSTHINLLREYRTRLITDVVTGKLDVRGAELPVLDEAEALEDWKTDGDADVDEMDEMEGVDA